MKKIAAFLLLIGFAYGIFGGCVTNQRLNEKRARFQDTIPTCIEGKDCQKKWNAAQVWVVKNCGMKLQIVTDAIIETYNSPKNSTWLAARVIKEPSGGDKYQIIIRVWCSNIIGCDRNTWDAAIDFNEYVNRF